MKIFITGATGYIGRQVALHLANKGHVLHALVRSKQKTQLLQHPNIVLFEGDLHQPEQLQAAAANCDVCLHAAAYAAIYTKQKELFEEININGTKNVFAAAKANGITRFILISSAGIYGPSEGNTPVTEKSVRKVTFFNEYERTKAIADDWVLEQNSPEMQTLSLNLTRVYGPGQLTEANAGTRLIQQVMQGWRIIPGDGKNIGNYVFIDDILIACENALTMGKGGNRYIIGGENLSFDEYFGVVKQATNARQKMIHTPVWLIMAVSYIMLLLAHLGRTPLITPQWAKRYMKNWILDSTKAQTELNHSPTVFKDGVKKTVAWLQNGSTLN